MALRAGWIASLLLFALVGLFLWLGLWQLERAEEKELAALENQQRGEVERLQLTGGEMDAEWMRYRQVEVQGEMMAEAQFFLDNRKHLRQAGYHVLVPLRVEGSDRAVMVNRGWIAQGVRRSELPLVLTPAGPLSLNGVVRVPVSHGFRMEQAPDAPLRLYLDLEQISQQTGLQLLPFVVRQQGDLASGYKDGLVRDWPPEQRKGAAEMHYGYALQWFAFALLLMGGWIALYIRQGK